MAKKAQPAKSGGLFKEAPAELKTSTPACRANIDGGSRGNPGPAAYGVVLADAQGKTLAKLKKYIGRNTNNVAEYYGLIAALDYAQSHAIRALRVESDSELLVKQMRGQYKVKSEELRPLFERAHKMAEGLESFRIDHVYREQNRKADALVNEALDETGGKPQGPAAPKAEARNMVTASGYRKIRARFRSGILYPLEDIELPDGAEVDILLRPVPPKS